jgi:dihydrodipicolinate synthase/N-acetylneuraminate lyase
MDEAAKLELEHRAKLYQFYVDCYIKGIAFFLGITAALLKFAIDSADHRATFSVAGILCSLVVLIPLRYAFAHQKTMAADFQRLAKATQTKPISVEPLHMLVRATTGFWIIIALAWVYIPVWLR